MVTGNLTRLSEGRATFCANSVQISLDCPIISGKLVRIAGLEPARVAPLPPQSSVSANSTICAYTENKGDCEHARGKNGSVLTEDEIIEAGIVKRIGLKKWVFCF